MAGKSNKGRSKRGSHNNNHNHKNNSSEHVPAANAKDHREDAKADSADKTPNADTEQKQGQPRHLKNYASALHGFKFIVLEMFMCMCVMMMMFLLVH